MSQPTRAAWIEIKQVLKNLLILRRRSPLGLRGLKFYPHEIISMVRRSQPTQAAWIEIAYTGALFHRQQSQPTRAAWIEIPAYAKTTNYILVAALLGCVD